MINHHPDENILTEFVTGSLEPAQALAVRTHLHYCPQCQSNVRLLEQLAGIMFEGLEPQPLTENSFDVLMSRIDNLSDSKTGLQEPEQSKTFLPPVLDRLMAGEPFKWRKLTRALDSMVLNTNAISNQSTSPGKSPKKRPDQANCEISLQKIRAGGKVPEHDHRGIEMTVVLQGSLSDADGIYHPGDFIVKNPGQSHQPVSARNEDCLCLSVQQAPVRLTGFFGSLLNPFIRLQQFS